jgi:hypothetical protein
MLAIRGVVAWWANLGLWRKGKVRMIWSRFQTPPLVGGSEPDPSPTSSSSSSPPDLYPAHGLQSAAAVLHRRRRRLYGAPSPYPSSLPPYLIAPSGPCCLHPVRKSLLIFSRSSDLLNPNDLHNLWLCCRTSRAPCRSALGNCRVKLILFPLVETVCTLIYALTGVYLFCRTISCKSVSPAAGCLQQPATFARPHINQPICLVCVALALNREMTGGNLSL